MSQVDEIDDVADALDYIKESEKISLSSDLSLFMGISEGTISNIYNRKSPFSRSSFEKYVEKNKSKKYKDLLEKFIDKKTNRDLGPKLEEKLEPIELEADESGRIRVLFQSASDLKGADREALQETIVAIRTAMKAKIPEPT